MLLKQLKKFFDHKKHFMNSNVKKLIFKYLILIENKVKIKNIKT